MSISIKERSLLHEKYEDFDMVVAVAGQPNVGKSTLINRLLGHALSHVGNWPGKTVDILAGIVEFQGFRILFVDLPGTYGLSGTSEEEEITRKYLIGVYSEEKHRHRRSICEKCPLSIFCSSPRFCPARVLEQLVRRKRALSPIQYSPDLVIAVVDATALERTMYLAVSILEVHPNVIIAVNKIDEAYNRGIYVDVNKLSRKLNAPVVPISALKGEGMKELLSAIIREWKRIHLRKKRLVIDYDILEPYIRNLESIVRKIKALRKYPTRWIAIRLLEGDKEFLEIIRSSDRELYKQVLREIDAAKGNVGMNLEDVISSLRYSFVSEILKDVIQEKTKIRLPEHVLKTFDRIIMAPVIGPVVSIGVIFLTMFAAFSINIGFPLNVILESIGYQDIASMLEEYSLVSILDLVFGTLLDTFKEILISFLPEIIVGFIVDGILSGLFFILTFMPLIFIVLFMLTLLEDSGILARIAMSLDSIFAKIGLSGKASFPLFLGFGCNVPAVMASRTMMTREEKIAVILASPFVLCQARMIVLIAIATIAFRDPLYQALAITTVLLLSVLLYVFVAGISMKLLGKKGEESSLIIDIPPLRKPSLRVAWWNSWILTKHFLEKAGTIIVLLSALVWALLSFGPSGYGVGISESYAALLGKALSPVALLWGISNPDSAWKIMFAFFQGFIAKEGLIVTIAQFAEGSFEGAWQALGLSPLQSFAILIAMMTYVPCVATLVTMYHELKSWKLVLLGIVLMVSLSIVLSAGIYWFFVLVDYVT